eukprot:848537_1
MLSQAHTKCIMDVDTSSDTDEQEPNPSDNDPLDDCKSTHHPVMHESPKSMQSGVQNPQTRRNLIRVYNSVMDKIESPSQTQPHPNLCDDLSHSLEMLNMLRPKHYHETVHNTKTTQLKRNHWRNTAYFYLIRSTIKQCIDLNYSVPVVISNKLRDQAFESVFAVSNQKLKGVLLEYKAHDDYTPAHNAHNELADTCVNICIDDESKYNPASEDQLIISTPSEAVIRIAQRAGESTATKRYRLYLVTTNKPAEAYVQLYSLCDEHFPMQSIQQEPNLFYLDLDIDLHAPVTLHGMDTQTIATKFSSVTQDAQDWISVSRSILTIEKGNTFIARPEQHSSNDIAIIRHLLEHIIDYSSYEFVARAVISLKQSDTLHPQQDALRRLWMQNVNLFNSECGSLQLTDVLRLQILPTMCKDHLLTMDTMYNIIRHVLHGLHRLSDKDLREKIATSVYYSFGAVVRSYFMNSVHLRDLKETPYLVFSLYPIFNYFRYFEGVYNSKSSSWGKGYVTKIQMEFVETLHNICISSDCDVNSIQNLMNDILQKLETDLSFRCLGYQHVVCLEGGIITFCYNEFTEGHNEFAQHLIYKMVKLIASKCNQHQAACFLDYIWKTESEFLFPIISTDYSLWINLFTPPTQQYMQQNHELLQRFNHCVKRSISKLHDTLKLKTLCEVLCHGSDANIPKFNAVDPGLTILGNHHLWSPDSSYESIKINLHVVLNLFTFIPYGTNHVDSDSIHQQLTQFMQMLLHTSASIRNYILSVYHQEAQTCTEMSDIIRSAILLSFKQSSCDVERCLLYLPCDEFYKFKMDTIISKIITGTQPANLWTHDEIQKMQALYEQHCVSNDDVHVSNAWNCVFNAIFTTTYLQLQDTDAHVRHVQKLSLCLATAKWIPFARAHGNTLNALNTWIEFVNTQLLTLQMHIQSQEITMSTMYLLYKNQDTIKELNQFVSKIKALPASLHETVGKMVSQCVEWNCCRIQMRQAEEDSQIELDDEFRNILNNWETTSYQIISSRAEWSMWYLLQISLQSNIDQKQLYKQLEDKHNKLKQDYTKLQRDYNQLEGEHGALLQQHHEYKTTEFSDGTKGLTNIGNTCFMNSILQSLSHIPYLAQHFMQTRFDVPLCQAFGAIVSNIWHHRNTKQSLHRFKSEMTKISSIYGTCNPQDPREFLDYLLNALHDKLNKGSADEYNDDANKIDMNGLDDQMASNIAWQVFSDQNKSVIKEMFYGQKKLSTKCRNCGYITVLFEPFRVLHVSTTFDKRNIKLSECIDDCLGEKPIYSKWYCKNCRTETRGSTDQTSIYKYPSILVIHLKKVEMQNIRKQPKVTYPANKPLDFSKYCISKKQNVKYDLYAVSTLSGYHCTAYARNKNKKWFLFNDSRVKSVHCSNVVAKNAYLLFYQRNY